MSFRRPTFAVVAALFAIVTIGTAAQEKPSLNDVLKRTAAYVAGFQRQLSGIVAEEEYVQDVAYTARIGGGSGRTRKLRSDLMLIKPADADRYVELRDVFEVDGAPVRERQDRLQPLLRENSATAGSQLAAIIAASAQYNIGSIQRNVNTPLMALQFLEAANQERVKFTHVPKPAPVFTDTPGRAGNDTAVFRVATEMWTVAFAERKQNTLIRTPAARDLPAHGRFWIDPATGSVLISELVVDGGGVIATITVSYQSEPLMGFLVPVEMRETYIRQGERIGGQARYGRFRRIE
jgi:hypothetical protein